MRNIFKCALLLIIAGACTNDDFITEEVDSPTKPVGAQSVNRSMDEVLQIANNAARLLENAQTRSVGRTIDPAATQYVVAPATRAGGGNDTLLYIVNYADEQGFAVISANRNAEGLLAVTERGSYGVDGEYYADNPGFTAFMEKAKAYTASAASSDSVFIVGDPIQLYPYDIYRTYIDDTIPITRIEPKIKVRWGVSETESKYTPNGYPGCSPIAMAQIMSYFKYPSNISITYSGASISNQYLDWNSMLEHEVEHRYKDCTATEEAHEAISQLVRQLGELGSCVYGTNSTLNYIEDAWAAFRDLGYSISNIVNTVDFNIPDLLKTEGKDYLLYMRGTDISHSSGHAWVADGLLENKIHYTSWVRRAFHINWEISSTHESIVRYLHFNWGREGHCNGYFSTGVYAPLFGSEYDYSSENSYNDKFDRNYNHDVSFFLVYRE